MQNSWKIIMQIKNVKKNNILHADGYNLMYHKFILLSIKWVKKLEESIKTMKEPTSILHLKLTLQKPC